MASKGDSQDEFDVPELVFFTNKVHHDVYLFISPTRPALSAVGKNVVVTGGGTGLGKAITIAFAQAGAASVSIIARRLDRLQNAAKEIAAAGPKSQVLYETADVAQRAAIENAMKSITDKVGEINVFVHGAGVLPKPGAVVSYDEKEFRRGFEVNVMSAFNAIQAFVPRAAPGARLFTISSAIGHFAPMLGVFNYAANKAFNIKMFDYVAAENHDLHVVNTQPGIVKTEINADLTVEAFDTPDLAGGFVVWLAFPEAEFFKSKFVWVKWDAEELIARSEEIKSSLLLKVVLNGAGAEYEVSSLIKASIRFN